MKRVFIEETQVCNAIRIIDTEAQTYHMHSTEKHLGFPFGIPMDEPIQKMGYKDANDCIKQLKSRGYLPVEIDYKEQMESERLGLLKLGVWRIKHYIEEDQIIKCSRFDDVCEKLVAYGMNFVDAQNQILAMYERELVIVQKAANA